MLIYLIYLLFSATPTSPIQVTSVISSVVIGDQTLFQWTPGTAPYKINVYVGTDESSQFISINDIQSTSYGFNLSNDELPNVPNLNVINFKLLDHTLASATVGPVSVLSAGATVSTGTSSAGISSSPPPLTTTKTSSSYDLAPTSSSLNSNPTSPSSPTKHSNVAAIVAGTVIGFLAIQLLIIGFLVHRRRRLRRSQDPSQPQSEYIAPVSFPVTQSREQVYITPHPFVDPYYRSPTNPPRHDGSYDDAVYSPSALTSPTNEEGSAGHISRNANTETSKPRRSRKMRAATSISTATASDIANQVEDLRREVQNLRTMHRPPHPDVPMTASEGSEYGTAPPEYSPPPSR